MITMQLSFDIPIELSKDLYDYGARTSGETHGVVLTKPHIVDLMLNIAGYTADKDLGSLCLLEPSCGHGAFLIPAVNRLLESLRRYTRSFGELRQAIRAYDIDEHHVALSRSKVETALREGGAPAAVARELAVAWVHQADFLLAPIELQFDVVVGNPPYVRIEQLSPILQDEYRRRYTSIFDRADLYVAFIERGLMLLGSSGILTYICADRWTTNRYGSPLRRLIAEKFTTLGYINLQHCSPFESDVIAYPSIFAIEPKSKLQSAGTKVLTLKSATPEECEAAWRAWEHPERTGHQLSAVQYTAWFSGDDPWVISSPQQIGVLRDLERRFPTIESSAHVGIGVATGNDSVYIVGQDADIEPTRLVPLVTRDAIQGGSVRDSGLFVINTFSEDGTVVDLDDYPRLKRYLMSHKGAIVKRHVAQKNPRSWFRTIDRVYPGLVAVPKLLIPDIAGANEVALDPGRYHPHHNLYFVTSDVWDMSALGALLSSKVALFFVWSYAVKMRGGYLRFQAQYLRRIRLPDPTSISERLLSSLKMAFTERNFERMDALALEVYGLGELPEFDFVDTRNRNG